MWPDYRDNIKSGKCADCGIVALLRWHFGPLQERKLCDVCGDIAWCELLAECGRLEEWLRLIADWD